MTILGLDNDKINEAMIGGLRKSLAIELKTLLMKTAEKEIDDVIDTICKKVEVNCNNYLDMFGDVRQVKLEWLINNFNSKEV